ncbi:ABC-transporter ATP-binding protein [Salmonella enterica subsp. enterica]|nr:ABC-transporter ATP-binding protein [Salmonella enterica subsp. enterica]
MQHGKCVENQRADTLLSAPTHPYTQKLLNSEPTGDPVPLPAGQTPLLEVDRLRVAFPIRKGILKRVVDHNVVVNNISFTLHPGETLGLVGESGSGKSTTGLALLRLIRSEGRIVFDGQSLDTLNRRQLLPVSPPYPGRIPGPELIAKPAFKRIANYRRRPARPPAYAFRRAARTAGESGHDGSRPGPGKRGIVTPLSFPAASVNVSPSPGH